MKKIKSFAALLLVVCSLALASVAFALPKLEYHALCVGHGDCTVFKMPDGHIMVVDASTSDEASHIVSYLKSMGVKAIDLFVATHPHNDHIGGAGEVFRNFRVKNVWDSGFARKKSKLQVNYLKMLQKSGAAFKRVKSGDTATLGGAKIRVLAPKGEITGTRSDPNNNSIIMLVKYGKVTFLLMADAEQEEQSGVRFPHANVMKAPHHGSKNGNYESLYEQVRPDIVTFSYGENERGKLPHKETRRLLLKYKPIRLDTADGDIVIRTDGENIEYPKSRAVQTVLKNKKK